mmetsp:Transcript_10059/g.13150  ORF Transcript_10059/g.13150 Transcript_10059/m.13150 type:complete len:94 (-) Transcript_10059:14-295(-)
MSHLRIDSSDEFEYLSLFGQYVLPCEIFDLIERSKDVHGEYANFTEVLDEMRRSHGMTGVVPDGLRFDVGDALSYVETLNHFATAHAQQQQSR